MFIVRHLCVCDFLALFCISYFYGTYMPCRVQSYIQGGLDKDIVDPDDRENILRKRRRLDLNFSRLLLSLSLGRETSESTGR